MRSMRSQYRCVCGRTCGGKLYVFDRAYNNIESPRSNTVDVTHKDPIHNVTAHARDASQNDLSSQAWHKVYDEEVKVAGDEIISNIKVTDLDPVVDAESLDINFNFSSRGADFEVGPFDSNANVITQNTDFKAGFLDNNSNLKSVDTDVEVVPFDSNVKAISVDNDVSTTSLVNDPNCPSLDDTNAKIPRLDTNVKVASLNKNTSISFLDSTLKVTSLDSNDNVSSVDNNVKAESLNNTPWVKSHDSDIDFTSPDYDANVRSSDSSSWPPSGNSIPNVPFPEKQLTQKGLQQKFPEKKTIDVVEAISSLEQRIEEEGNVKAVKGIKNDSGSSSQLQKHQTGEELNSVMLLVQQLQTDKGDLAEKLSASQECQMYLKKESQRLAKHIEEMTGMDSSPIENQTDTSSTDTEKELEQFKRQYIFLTQELKILREENLNLHQSVSVALNCKHKNTQDELKQIAVGKPNEILPSKSNIDENADQLAHKNDCIKTEMNGRVVGHKDNSDVIVLEKGTQTLYHTIDQLNRYKTTVSNVKIGVTDLKKQSGDIRRSFNSLKNDAGMFRSTMTDMLAETNKKIFEALSSMNEQNEKLKQKYIRELKLRKQLQNQVVELKGNIRVFCRIRPCIKEDNPINNSELMARVVASPDMIDEGLVYINNKGKLMEFDMDKVFGMESSQEEIFDEVSPLVKSALDGYNVCIFAYGQTGSGKTYTMEGPSLDPGINQRALQLLFEGLDQDGWTYGITASVLEIYNETIRDLLNPDLSNKLEVKLKQEGGLHVPGVVVVPVTSLQEINKVFETGRQHRCTASTSMNDLSSRSHCLLCVTVRGRHHDTGINTTGRINLVDLAGSERLGRSHADGVRLKEAQNINKSLACLGDVIHALRSKQGHVPYRNSKLTYLLQDSLGGDSKTLMIVQISPAESNVSETVCTLNFGQRVRSVEMGQATRNVVPSPTIKRPTNLNILQTPPSPLSPSSPSSVFASPTSLLSPSSPQTALSSPASPTRPRRYLSGASSSSQTPSSTPSSFSSPTTSRKSTMPSSTSSASESSPRLRRSSTLVSSSSHSSTPSSPQTSSPLLRIGRSTSTPSTSSSSSSSSPKVPPSSPSKLRKSTLIQSSTSSSTSPSSPSPRLRRSALSSTTTPTSTISSSPLSSSSPCNSPNTSRRSFTRHHPVRSATSPTKASLARSLSINQNSTKPPIQNSIRSKNTPVASENSRQNFYSSYPSTESSATRKTNNKRASSSDGNSPSLPFRV